MNRYTLLFIMLMTKMMTAQQEHWIRPERTKRLDQITFLASHNAYANKHDGWRYAQQHLNLQEQLALGVRGFLLDIHWYNNDIVLSHGGCRGIFKLLKNGCHDSLRTACTTFIDFLKKNPQEVITIFFENYVPADQLHNYLISMPELMDYVLTPKDWNPTKKNNEWPTLGWLQHHNKRIIIFNEDKTKEKVLSPNHCFYPVWHYVIESQYGTTNLKKVVHQRKESLVHGKKQRSLYLLNFFGTISIAGRSKQRNSYANLKNLIDRIHINLPAKYPNWIALDFIDQGNAMVLVNELNSIER